MVLVLALPGALPAAGGGTIAVVGDSLSAGYGIERQQGWVALLQARLDEKHPGWKVVNASISGDTSRGGSGRIDGLLKRHDVDIGIVELGGNDGLRGIGLQHTRKNLADIIEAFKASGARVLLVGMQIPPNLGPAYTQRFKALYPQLASTHQTELVPFLLEGVAGNGELMQSDGIHPTAAAQPRLLDNVWTQLEPLL